MYKNRMKGEPKSCFIVVVENNSVDNYEKISPKIISKTHCSDSSSTIRLEKQDSVLFDSIPLAIREFNLPPWHSAETAGKRRYPHGPARSKGCLTRKVSTFQTTFPVP